MKIAASVILYNPEEVILENILSYYDEVDFIIIIDNSETPDLTLVEEFISMPKCLYIGYGENLGVAKALNIAVQQADKLGYGWLMTMDQDSYFDKQEIQQYLSCVNNMASNVDIGIIGPVYEKSKRMNSLECNIEDATHIITSGSILNLKAYKEVGQFDDRLFIDEVDTDFCYRLRLYKYRVVILRNIFMHHELGKNRIVRNWFLGRKVERNVHSPLRIYYIVRNFLYTYFKYKIFFPNELKANKSVTINRIKNSFLYSGNRMKVLYYLIKAICHFRKNKFGKFES